MKFYGLAIVNHLVYLRTFLDAYRAGSITRAAQRLGITQPAASAHVAALEEMLGRPLFVRQARGVAPTPAAEDLARSIAVQLDAIEATMGAARARSGKMSGAVHLVGPAEYLSARVSPTLAPLLAEGLRLLIRTGNRTQIHAALDAGHADLAFTASRPERGVHGWAELDRERLLLIAAPSFATRLRGRSLTPELLSGLPCLAYDESLPLVRPFFAHVFGAAPELQAAATAPDLRLLRGMARTGAGWTVLPDYICAEDLAQGALAELGAPRPGPENALYVLWNKTALRHPRVVYVRDFLLRAMRQG